MQIIMSPSVDVLAKPTTPTERLLWTTRGTKRSHSEAFCSHVQRQLTNHLQTTNLLAYSAQMRAQYRDALTKSSVSMLPSFNHTLPSGEEHGSYLALDVGGSNFRLALVQLNGLSSRPESPSAVKILKRRDYSIDNGIRGLRGRAFFSWMADRIQETFAGDESWVKGEEAMPMGISWSFPVEQRSVRDGALLQMGKDFKAVDGLLGENLADLITDACRAKGLNVEMVAIVNDSSASLLSRAYTDPTTRIALILGTGCNAGIHLPVSSFQTSKLGRRPSCWRRAAEHVVVNSELSMFGGGGILPLSRWDEALRRGHPLPDYQPLEYFVCGRYLGEIVRLALVEGIVAHGLFGGQVPKGFDTPYTVQAETLAAIEADPTYDMDVASRAMHANHPLELGTTYSVVDLKHVQRIVRALTDRAAAYLATALHGLLVLRQELEGEESAQTVCIGCEGSFIEKYPGFMARVQRTLDEMFGVQGVVRLEMTYESSLLGAAVAVSCQEQ